MHLREKELWAQIRNIPASAPSSLQDVREMLQVRSVQRSQPETWSSVPSAASFRLRITPVMKREKRREDCWRGREEHRRKAERKELLSYTKLRAIRTCPITTANICVTSHISVKKGPPCWIPPQPWEVRYYSLTSVETSAPKDCEFPNLT